MKDYTLDQASKKDYIVDMFLESDGTMTVVFADGTRFPGIAYTEENISTIASTQELQAKEGLENMYHFEGVARASAWCSGVCLAGFLFSCAMAFRLADPGAAYFIGGISLGGIGLIAPDYFKNRSIMKELKKILYRNENRRTLDSYQQYPNALVGIKNRKYFDYCQEHGEDPFSVLFLNCFTTADMKTIVTNVEREKQLQFTYQKKNAK